MDAWEDDLIVGSLRNFQPLSWVLVNGIQDEETWDDLVRTWHYLGYRNMVGPRVKYLVLTRDVPIAAISFNRASLHVNSGDALGTAPLPS